MNFSSIAGNKAPLSKLRADLIQKSVFHAYIITGPRGSGKKTLAGLFAAALVCSGGGEACPGCGDCQKALKGIHPDIITVGEDDKATPVSVIRAMRDSVFTRPNESQRKVYIIKGTLNIQAQNALLTIIEEPPRYAVFLLLCENNEGLLPTVRSRCSKIQMSPVAEKEALPVLRNIMPSMDDNSLICALNASGGIIGGAIELLSNEKPASAAGLISALIKKDEFSFFSLCQGLEKTGRDDFINILNTLLSKIHNALIYKKGGVFTDRLEEELAVNLTAGELIKLRAFTEKLIVYAGANTGIAHICGALCAGFYL